MTDVSVWSDGPWLGISNLPLDPAALIVMTSKNWDGDWRPEYITAGWPQLVTIMGDIVITPQPRAGGGEGWRLLEENWRSDHREAGECYLK